VQLREPAHVLDGFEHGRGVKIAVEPWRKVVEQCAAVNRADVDQGDRDHLAHAPAKVLRAVVEHAEQPGARLCVFRGTGANGRDAAHGEEFQLRSARSIVGVQRSHGQNNAICGLSAGGTEARKGRRELQVRLRTWEPRAAGQPVVKRARLAFLGLIKRQRQGVFGRTAFGTLGHGKRDLTKASGAAHRSAISEDPMRP